jgi:hypothetical protein
MEIQCATVHVENHPDEHAGPRGSDRRFDRNTARAKEVSEILESCYCGRMGEIEDREPVATGDGGRALRCPIADIWSAWNGSQRKPGDTPSKRRKAGNWRWRRRYTSAVCAGTAREVVSARSDRTTEGKTR